MTRLISALILLPVVVGIMWGLPPWGTLLLCLMVLLLSLREYDVLVARSGLDVIPGLTMVLSVGMFLLLTLGLRPERWLLLVPAVTGAALVVRGRVPAHSVAVAASTIFGVVYLGYGVATVVLIRQDFGAVPLLSLILMQVASDSAQYYTGRAFGRSPLAPTLSPKKTREGAIGGLIAAAVVLATLGRLWLPGIPLWQLAVLGLGLGVAGIAGDLFESMLKRSADVKDASGLIPGHGGMLDRIDALLFSTPLYYVALSVLWSQGPRP
ncbi:MAG: phosphatidate cytidylyltransferase [Luteitalea sp.]|nr:phosphatidate cytidylyltransferase [Acidobacteriota bacterium]